MSVFSSSQKKPYFATMLSSKLMLDDPIHYIMAAKVRELASNQPGYLGSESGSGEVGFLVIYWQTKQAAEAWLNHDMQRRFLSLSESFWYEEYSVKLFEVLRDTLFKAEAPSLYASRFPRIVTERGILKVLNESQAGLLHDYVNQEKAFLTPWEPTRSEGYYSFETCLLRVREMRQDFLEGKGVVLCLLSPNEDKMLGYSNYSNFNRGVCQVCNLGYSLRESEQGKGVMHEMLSAGVEYIQKELNISRIQASYMPRNAKSAAVLERMGFAKEGIAKEYLKINGVWEDHILTAFTAR
ncbi:30S ribosomal protein [Marinomonas ushuaiensis DSM 15871]|uniref:30S ribosomal protein n=1 Tax=Marinomonas ushuaiensis DSM 15871 TaxID=1122207 RepID=X7E211_9GAMM|nr:GNAT family N-acetyltransferase [Marinomonas ushuaiensis]ETX09875.1 30S ribosomal protein [Marinomonas ushuaiensis DSM 15871]